MLQGVWLQSNDLCDLGKGETYVSETKEILYGICEEEREKERILNSVSCIMKDRSATEQKAKSILLCDINHD